MKKNLKQFSQLLGTQILLLIATATAVGAAQGSPAEKDADAATNEIRKSTFQDDLKNGKDPFFPKSVRRTKTAIPTAITVAPVAQLALKGISGPTNRRFALINNQPLAAGESAFVRIPSGLVKVHCWEINENSVIVSVEGDPERKELRLRDNP
jgi:hypothetical protein